MSNEEEQDTALGRKWLQGETRKLLDAFPGVSSYSTVRNLIIVWGVGGAKRQLEAWSLAGTSAPRGSR